MTAAASASPTKHPANFTEMIKQIEEKIASLGPGPLVDKQREEKANLETLLSRVMEEAQRNPPKDSAVLRGGIPGVAHRLNPIPAPISSNHDQGSALDVRLLDRARMRELVTEVDPTMQLEEDVEEILYQVADDFVDKLISGAADFARHRSSDLLDTKDAQLYLERACNMQVPGFSSEELRTHKRSAPAEAHKQRMAFIRKLSKKS